MSTFCQTHSKLFSTTYRNKCKLLVLTLDVMHRVAPADLCSLNSHSLPTLWPSTHCSLKRPMCNFQTQYSWPLNDMGLNCTGPFICRYPHCFKHQLYFTCAFPSARRAVPQHPWWRFSHFCEMGLKDSSLTECALMSFSTFPTRLYVPQEWHWFESSLFRALPSTVLGRAQMTLKFGWFEWIVLSKLNLRVSYLWLIYWLMHLCAKLMGPSGTFSCFL